MADINWSEVFNNLRQEAILINDEEERNLVLKVINEFSTGVYKNIPIKKSNGWYGENTECPQCHTVASGNYCNSCGQALAK